MTTKTSTTAGLDGYALTKPGKVASVFFGKEDHGILTCLIRVDVPGFTQGFGGLVLRKGSVANSFVSGVCDAFGASKLDDIKGRPVTACWVMDTWNEPISALHGGVKLFDLYAWRRSHDPKQPDRIAERHAELARDVELAGRRLDEAQKALAKFLGRLDYDGPRETRPR